MQTQPSCSGPAPLPPDVAEASAPEATRFGVFRRHRSPAGVDVFPRGLPTRGARPVEAVPLHEALLRRWDDDRHFVLYTSDKPYRINNAALGKVRVEVRLLALDVDNHDDAPGWLEGERAKIAALLAAHPGGFVHTTRRGWRALFALPAFPIGSEDDKERFALWYARVAAYVFERFGVVCDDALTRWNQPVRLPHVVRDGRAFDAEIIAGDAHALGVFELPSTVPDVPDLRALARVLPRWGGVAKRWQPTRQVLRVAASGAFDHVPLPPHAERIAAAEKWAREAAPRAIQRQGGRATARSVAATLHVGFALDREEVEQILTGPYNRRRCSPPWSDGELDDLRSIARAVARAPVNAWGFMLSRDRSGIEVARATLEATAAARTVVALEDVPARLLAAVEQHRAVVLRATYGAGKSHAISRYIASRTTGRVVVVVPRHENARAWVASLSAAGESDVAYHASVVQRRDEAGRRHCDNKVALKLYRHGGDVVRDVCPSCPRVATCPAYAERPNPSARVHVLPREMIPTVGVTDDDLVVFDDAAVDLLAWHRLGVRQIQRLTSADDRFLPRVQAWFLRIFLYALLAGARGAEEHARSALGATFNIAGQALRYVASRLIEGQRSPRVPRGALAENGDELAETLCDVSRLRQVLRFASAYAEGAEVRWSEGSRTVHGESAAAKLLRTHAGRLVVLDAAANVEELRVLRSDLHVERLDVDDAGDASRVLLFAKNATRTALRDGRRRRELLDSWLGAVFEQLTARRARRPVFVVYKGLAAEVRGHPAVVAWCAADPRREVRVTHYGAVRGSNRFRRCDAVVTLCDPWLNGDDVVGRADWLGLDEPSYRIALATAELGQAHGRSRSVRRRRRITHVHVGRLVPDGWGPGVVVEPLGGPPERSHGVAERIEFGALVGRLGGNRAVAELLGCSSSAVAGWKGGSRGLPRDVLARMRQLATGAAQSAVSSGEAGRGALAAEMDAPPCIKQPRGCVHETAATPASPAEEAVSLDGVGGFQVLDPLPVEGSLPSEKIKSSSPSMRVQVLPEGEGQGCAVPEIVVLSTSGGGKSSDGGFARWLRVAPAVPIPCMAMLEVAGYCQERGYPAMSPFSLNERAPVSAAPGPSEWGPARALAVLELLEPSPPPPISAARGSPRTFDDELALLAEAQAHARRRLGL